MNDQRIKISGDMKYYQRDFQATANRWWRTLSINEMKSFETKYQTIYRFAIPSEIAFIYETETP